MKKIVLTIIFSLFITSHALPIYFNHIGLNEGLAQLSVMSIHQDELGRMWFGTNEGISIYDGERIITYKTISNPDGSPLSISGSFLPGYMVNAIVSDKNNNIYCHIDNSLIKYDIKKQRFSCLQERNVTAIASINGILWYATQNSTFIWNDDNKKSEFQIELDKNLTVNEICRTQNNNIWLGTRTGLFQINNNGKVSCIIPDKDIYNLFESSNGDLWVGCRTEGMYKISPRGNVTFFQHDPNNSNSIAND